MKTIITAHQQGVEQIGLWGFVLGTAAAADVWAIRTGHDTLSKAHGDAVGSRRGRIVLGFAWLVLAGHLWRWPRFLGRLDPFGALARAIPAKA